MPLAAVIDVAAGVLQRGRPTETFAVRKAHGDTAGQWEFPGGKREPDESLPQCLQRELAEELAISAAIGPYVGLSEYSSSTVVIRLHAFLVTDWVGDIKLVDHDDSIWLLNDELADLEWSPADIPLVAQVKYLSQDFAVR